MDPRAERRGASRAAFEVLLAAGLAGVYFVLARVGLQIHAIGGFATLVWPPVLDDRAISVPRAKKSILAG